MSKFSDSKKPKKSNNFSPNFRPRNRHQNAEIWLFFPFFLFLQTKSYQSSRISSLYDQNSLLKALYSTGGQKYRFQRKATSSFNFKVNFVDNVNVLWEKNLEWIKKKKVRLTNLRKKNVAVWKKDNSEGSPFGTTTKFPRRERKDSQTDCDLSVKDYPYSPLEFNII